MKKVFSLFFILLALVSLVACGTESNTNEKDEYKVQFYCDGNSIEIMVKNGDTVTSPILLDTIKDLDSAWVDSTGKEFDFSTPVKSDLVLTLPGEYEFKVVFKNPNGDILRSNKYAPFEDIVFPDSPTYPSDIDYDYTFSSWDKDYTKAIGNVEINAVYNNTPRIYSVKLLDSNNSVLKTIEGNRGDKIDLPTASKSTDDRYSYEYKYWVDENNIKYNPETGITGDMTLKPFFKRTPVKFDCKDKVISIVGDSISTFYAEGSPLNSYYNTKDSYFFPVYSSWLKDVNKTWWAQLANKLEAKIGVNNSWSGSSLYNNGNPNNNAAMNDCRLDTLNENGEPDIIIVFIGANDNVNGHTTTQFENAYRSLLSKLEAKYPKAYVFCVNMGYSAYRSYNYKEETRLAYNEIIARLCDEYQTKLIDLASVQTTETYSVMLGDALHPSCEGMNRICDICYETIKEYLNSSQETGWLPYV